ncbi:hypothetical protein ABT299_03085 [Spirillospora sp. NPDC000708]|jgi:hypothetical protein
MRSTAPRTRFAEKREDIVPRTLRDLIAADAQRLDEDGRRHRKRRIMPVRRVT